MKTIVLKRAGRNLLFQNWHSDTERGKDEEQDNENGDGIRKTWPLKVQGDWLNCRRGQQWLELSQGVIPYCSLEIVQGAVYVKVTFLGHKGGNVPWNCSWFSWTSSITPTKKSINGSSDNVTGFEVCDVIIQSSLRWSVTGKDCLCQFSCTYRIALGIRELSSAFWSGRSPSSRGWVYGN